MKLFFETAVQGSVFLLALPIGIMLGLCIDVSGLFGKWRIIPDLLCMLLAGFALVLLTFFTMENGLQLYHLFAVLIGMMLYYFGIGRVAAACKRKLQQFRINKRSKKSVQENNSKTSNQ